MIKWLQEYQDEAVNCDAIVLATILNPRFRVKFFSLHYPEHEITSQALIETAFEDILQEPEAEATPPPPPEDNDNTISPEPDISDVFGDSIGGPSKSMTSELDDFLQGRLPIKKDQTPLNWWKVCFGFHRATIYW